MEKIIIWKLTTFCRFYGRIIPYFPHNDENEKFNSFHTYTRNPNVDELKVKFEPNLAPMNFIDLVSDATSFYVMGHGSSWTGWDGKHYYESYTLYKKQRVLEYLQNVLTEEKCKKAVHELELIDQVKITLEKD